ncbi:MAG: PEGA domain-containing protein [Polyangiaceae bacterium]|nr:PEGA domain-containing protein [Polyangiaceae bacterium]
MPSLRPAARSCSLVALATGLTLGVVAFAPAPARADSVEELYRRGNELYRQKRWQEAYDAYVAAFAVRKSVDIAGNLGDVALTLGKPREAAEHLALALRHFPTGKPEARQRAEERLAQAKALVGTLTVTVNVEGARVLLGEREVGRAPLEHELYVEAGATHVRVTAPGYAEERRTVALDRGEAKSLVISLQPEAAPAVAPTPPPEPPAPARPPAQERGAGASSSGLSTKTAVLIGGSALTAVGLGVGIAGLVSRGSAQSDADSLQRRARTELGPNGCAVSPNATVCRDLVDALDRRESAATLSTVGFIGAGVFGAATVAALVLWPEGGAGVQPAALRVEATPTAGGATLSFRKSFF